MYDKLSIRMDYHKGDFKSGSHPGLKQIDETVWAAISNRVGFSSGKVLTA